MYASAVAAVAAIRYDTAAAAANKAGRRLAGELFREETVEVIPVEWASKLLEEFTGLQNATIKVSVPLFRQASALTRVQQPRWANNRVRAETRPRAKGVAERVRQRMAATTADLRLDEKRRVRVGF